MICYPPLETKRLTLRCPRRDDAPDVFAYASNPHVLFYTAAETPQSVEETEKFIDFLIGSPDDSFAWVVCLKGEDRAVGIIDGSTEGTTGSIHYALAEEFWNKGLMTEAVPVVLDWMFETYPQLACVATAAMRVNRGSSRVMEKCGMEYTGSFLEKWEKFEKPVELVQYSISREKWESSL